MDLLLQKEVFVMKKNFRVDVFDQNPERLEQKRARMVGHFSKGCSAVPQPCREFYRPIESQA